MAIAPALAKNKKQIPKAKPKPQGKGLAVANGGDGVSQLVEY